MCRSFHAYISTVVLQETESSSVSDVKSMFILMAYWKIGILTDITKQGRRVSLVASQTGFAAIGKGVHIISCPTGGTHLI